MNKVFYEKRKTQKGSYCDCVYVDVGYRTIFLTFDRSAVAEILGVSAAELYKIDPDTKIELGSLKAYKEVK